MAPLTKGTSGNAAFQKPDRPAGKKMKRLVIAVTVVLGVHGAAAQSKRDIRGIYPGMPASQALATLQDMDCHLFATAEYTFTPTCIFRPRDFSKNEDLHAFLASNLPNAPVWAVVLAFSSVLTREEIAAAIARQFQIKMGPHDIAKPEDDHTRVDLGSHLLLRLAPEQGSLIQGYRLSLWDAALKAEEDKAEVENATPKF
jgi:hypothetical protein